MPTLACWRDGDGDRRTALRAAPSLGVFDKASSQAFAAVLWTHIEVADLAETTPFDIEHGRDGDNGLRGLAVYCKRAPTEGIGEHSIEILRDTRQRRRELFLAEEPRQQFNRCIASFVGHSLDFAGQALPRGLDFPSRNTRGVALTMPAGGRPFRLSLRITISFLVRSWWAAKRVRLGALRLRE